jgi:hypothetical protein
VQDCQPHSVDCMRQDKKNIDLETNEVDSKSRIAKVASSSSQEYVKSVKVGSVFLSSSLFNNIVLTALSVNKFKNRSKAEYCSNSSPSTAQGKALPGNSPCRMGTPCSPSEKG